MKGVRLGRRVQRGQLFDAEAPGQSDFPLQNLGSRSARFLVYAPMGMPRVLAAEVTDSAVTKLHTQGVTDGISRCLSRSRMGRSVQI